LAFLFSKRKKLHVGSLDLFLGHKGSISSEGKESTEKKNDKSGDLGVFVRRTELAISGNRQKAEANSQVDILVIGELTRKLKKTASSKENYNQDNSWIHGASFCEVLLLF